VIICPNCGKENQDHYKFCLGCGSDLPQEEQQEAAEEQGNTPPSGIPAASDQPEEEQAAAEEPPQEEAAVQEEPEPAATQEQQEQPAMAEHSETAAPGGPEPAPAAEQAVDDPSVCPNCGSPIAEGFAFCGKCGHRIGGVPAAQPVSTAPAAAKLVFIQPDGSPGGTMPLQKGENKIGRASGGFLESDPFLSPIHTEFIVDDNSVSVKDAGSLNGIYVRIPPNVPIDLIPGDVIRVGQELLLFELLEEGEEGPDGTKMLGSPIEGLWGKVSLMVGKDQFENSFPIGGDGVVLGRERGDIVFPEDGYVSGSHLKIQRKGIDQFELIDLQSSNGSFLKVRDQVDLEKGAYLLMGQQLFQVMF